MKVKYLILFAAGLLVLNVFAWQEVFKLNNPEYLQVYFFSVGQGDSQFIETPQGHQILIDGGPNSLVLEKLNKIMPFWDKTIDMVILTHPEKDHMSGLLDVLERYKVDYFIWTGVIKNNAENKILAEILEDLKEKPDSIKIINAYAGIKIKAGDAQMEIIYPLENLVGQEIKDANNTSIVGRLAYRENSFLFTGDISSVIEKKLAGLYNLKSDVLKVAHHGSKYSTSDLFLRAVKPNIAIIGVGKNSYGHPTQEVLNRLMNFGSKIFRTDIDGDVKILSNGRELFFENK